MEYKGDRTAVASGNAFIELTSVDKDGKPGWAYTSQARYLFYYLPGLILYVLTFEKLHNRLSAWIARYPQRSIPNRNYHTIGVLVPLVEFERHAIAKVNL